MRATSLPTRPLGTTGLHITGVGFGAWAVGGEWAFGWGAQDDAESVAAIRHAVESGVSWVDTAAVYGLGHSEEVVREALSPYSTEDRPSVFTKCGMVWDDGAGPTDSPRRVGAPESIRAECEASLRRLGVDVLDLLQLHWAPEDGTPLEDTWSTLLDLQREGRARHVGVSNLSVAQLQACAALGHVATLQPPFSAIARRAAGDLLPWCAARGTGVIAYSPMQSGLLTGAFSEERAAALPEGDWRKRSPDFSGGTLRRNLALAETFRAVAERHDVPVPAVSVAWTLAFEGMSGAIVGARNPGQVDGWLPAATLVLTRQDLDEIAAAMTQTGAGQGPKHPTGPTEAPGAGGHGPSDQTLAEQTAVAHDAHKPRHVLDPETGRS